MPELEEMKSVLSLTTVPIPEEFLRRVRIEGIDDLGQPVKRLVAAGGEPCRDVLRRATAGEELLLASFSPFMKPGPYREYGPVFVLARDAHEEPERDPRGLAASGYLREQFAVRAYSEDEEILDAALVKSFELEETMERFLQSQSTSFLHVRFPAYGCFACRIERA